MAPPRRTQLVSKTARMFVTLLFFWSVVSLQLVSRQAEPSAQLRVIVDAPPSKGHSLAPGAGTIDTIVNTSLRNNDKNTSKNSSANSTTATNTTGTTASYYDDRKQPPHHTTSTTSRTTSSSSSSQKVDRAVLVIASVPYDSLHTAALWTQLECFTAGIDVVVLAVPLGGRAMESIRQRAMQVLGIPTHIYEFVNDRYDVGLWCDALSALGYNNNHSNNSNDYNSNDSNHHHQQQQQQNTPFARTLLLNDSVFAIRHFSGILESLRDEKDKHLVGLSYSNTEGFWLESVFRGFSPRGIQLFMNHSCHCGPDHPSFGRELASTRKQKRAIVDYHEIGLIRSFTNNQNNNHTNTTTTMGLFSSDPPNDWRNKRTWVQHEELWRMLKDEQNFPAAKVNQAYSITAHNASTCSSQLDQTLLQNLNYSLLEITNRRMQTTATTTTSRSAVIPHTTTDAAMMADLVDHQRSPPHKKRFLPPETLSRAEIYGAAWWQSIDRFMQDDYSRVRTLEDGSFRPIYNAGNGTLDVRMTVDWLELAVEHWSDYHRLLDTNASQYVIAKLEDYVSATITAFSSTTTTSSSSSSKKKNGHNTASTTTTTAMQSTLAVLPFQACSNDKRVSYRVSGKFCPTALAATIASLVRQGVGRVVVVTSYDAQSSVQDAIGDLARRFAPTTQIVAIPTDIISGGMFKQHMPKTALVGLYKAWRVQNTTWLGHNPRANIKYIYFTEPDQILIGQLSMAAMQSTMDRHHILVPHRLEVIPHSDDFRDIESASVKIPSRSHRDDDVNPIVLDAPGACCDSGRKQRVQKCRNEPAWYKCMFPPHNNSFAHVFGRQQDKDGHPQLMRIQQGSGLTALTMQGIDVENSFCRPQRTAESCQTTAADQVFGVGRGVAVD
jgi:hypothetical protein